MKLYDYKTFFFRYFVISLSRYFVITMTSWQPPPHFSPL